MIYLDPISQDLTFKKLFTEPFNQFPLIYLPSNLSSDDKLCQKDYISFYTQCFSWSLKGTFKEVIFIEETRRVLLVTVVKEINETFNYLQEFLSQPNSTQITKWC